MKGLMFMVVALGLGAATLMGAGTGAASDASFERTIDRPPAPDIDAIARMIGDGSLEAVCHGEVK